MTQDRSSTRRSFLKGSALLAAPLAVAVPAAARAGDERDARLRRLEDEEAIRSLHRDWLRRVNAGEATSALFTEGRAAPCLDGVCSLSPDLAYGAEAIELAADGRSAQGRYGCRVETETRLDPQNTLAQMALAQGGGVVRRSERRSLRADYVKVDGRWMIAGIETAPV